MLSSGDGGLMNKRKYHDAPNRYQSSLLDCSNCRARGALTLDRSEVIKPVKHICIAGDFHLETGRTRPDAAIIVCNLCDEIWGELPAVEILSETKEQMN